MTVKEKFERWYNKEYATEYTIEEIEHYEEYFHIKLESYTAGHKEGKSEGRKETLEDMKKILADVYINDGYGIDAIDEYIDTELEKLK